MKTLIMNNWNEVLTISERNEIKELKQRIVASKFKEEIEDCSKAIHEILDRAEKRQINRLLNEREESAARAL